MILPILSYGDPILKKKTQEIGKSYPNLKELIENMYETMYAAPGVGLAAPQVGLSIRLFDIASSGIQGGHHKAQKSIYNTLFLLSAITP